MVSNVENPLVATKMHETRANINRIQYRSVLQRKEAQSIASSVSI